MKRFLIFTALLFLMACKPEGALVIETDQGDIYIQPELAITSEERRIGLMNREHLDQDAGMLFVFKNDIKPSFWMKNTLIPLDMVFISNDFYIVDIVHKAEPCKTEKCPLYGTDKNSRYVLELNAGFTKKHAIKIGDKVRYTLP